MHLKHIENSCNLQFGHCHQSLKNARSPTKNWKQSKEQPHSTVLEDEDFSRVKTSPKRVVVKNISLSKESSKTYKPAG